MSDDTVARARAPRLNTLSFAIALALGSTAVQAATITVTDPGDAGTVSTCTLRQAVAAHNLVGAVGACAAGSASGDTIVFLTSVNAVTLDSSLVANAAANLEIDGGAGLGQVSVSLASGQAGSVIVKGSNATSALTLTGLTITGGNAISNTGGGVYSSDSTTLSINHCVITNNTTTTTRGGGISASTVVITDSTVSNNSSAGIGGGVFASSNVTLTNTTISGNTAAGSGGGVYGNISSESSTISANSPNGWNGVQGDFRDTRIVDNHGFAALNCRGWNPTGHISLSNSIVSGNTGAVPPLAAAGNCYNITIVDSEVSANTDNSPPFKNSHAGLRGQNVIVRNSTFYNNRVLRGVYEWITSNAIYAAGSLTIANSTIADNSCDCNSFSRFDVWVPPVAQFDSSVIRNLATTSGSTPQGAHNIANKGASEYYSNIVNLSQLTSTITGNAALGPLADNGCAVKAGAASSAACVKTRSLGVGSVAINAGAAGSETTDQRGAGFPRVIGSAADIGAFEAPAGLLVVSGNGNAITDGDTTPSTPDFTDFGASHVGTAVSLTYVLSNTASVGPLDISGIVVSGANAADFVVTSPVAFPLVIAPNATSTLTLSFNPIAVGNRHATITLTNDGSAHPAYQFAVQGEGTTLPSAKPLSISVPFDTAQVLQLAGTDPSPNGLFIYAYALASGPSHGTLAFDPLIGRVTYTPNPTFSGSDAFTYTVTDVNGTSLPATVSLSVASASALVAQPASVSTAYLTPVTVALGATDPNPGISPISFVITTPPAHGTVTLGVPTASGTAPDGAHAIAAANGSVMATYTPAFNFNGTDTFAFTASNINGTSAPATVSIAVAKAIVPIAVPTPALSPWAWLALMGELGLAAWFALRRFARRGRRH